MTKVPGVGVEGKVNGAAGETRAESISRRAWLGGAALVVGAGAICMMSSSAMAKASQADAKYQGEPKGELKCSNCVHFEAPSSCKVVDGSISENGWCALYAAKPKG